MKLYQPVIKRIFKKLAIEPGKRSKSEEKKIKRAIYKAVSKEILAFIWDSLDPFKRLAFEADIAETKGDLRKTQNLIISYLAIIPDYQPLLEERLHVFEAKFYANLLSLKEERNKK